MLTQQPQPLSAPLTPHTSVVERAGTADKYAIVLVRVSFNGHGINKVNISPRSLPAGQAYDSQKVRVHRPSSVQRRSSTRLTFYDYISHLCHNIEQPDLQAPRSDHSLNTKSYKPSCL